MRKVLMCPHYVMNPYMGLLADSLGEFGYEVEFVVNNERLGTRKALDCPVLHLHWQPAYAATRRSRVELVRYFRQLLILKAKGTRIIWTIHNSIPHESKSRLVDKVVAWLIAYLSDVSICHSEHAKKLAVGELAINPDKIVIIPHGNYVGVYENAISKSSARKRLGLSENAQVALFLGLVRPYKGVFELIDAFRYSALPNSILVIAGKLMDLTESEIRERIGGDERIKLFAGRVPDEELQVYFNAADLVTFPYQRSLTSGAAILAMSYGKACLAFRHEGMKSILDDKGALLIDPDEEGSLGDGLAKGLRDAAFTESAGKWNFEKCQQWNWDVVGGLTAGCYKTTSGGNLV